MYELVFAGYRLLLTLFAVLIVGRLTTLGDSGAYLSSSFNDVISTMGLRSLLNDTAQLKLLTSVLQLVFRLDILVHLFFSILGSVGLIYLMRSSVFQDPKNRIIQLVFWTPSLNMWSGIVGKEAILVLWGCVFAYQILCIYYDEEINYFLLLISVFIFFLYKPFFTPGMVQLSLILLFVKYVKPKSWLIFILGLLTCIINVVLIYLARDIIILNAEWIVNAFSDGARSNRPTPFLFGESFFTNLWPGIGIAFWGPLYYEIKGSILHLFSFVESFFIVTLFVIYVAKALIKAVLTQKIAVVSIFSILSLYFWILIFAYPFGVINPGTAIRYRTDYLILLVVPLLFNKRKVESFHES